MENPRDCENDYFKSNDNDSTKCDNNLSSNGKDDDKYDTDDSNSDDNACKNASRRWHTLKNRAIIKEINIPQTHNAAFDWTVPYEKIGLMKSVTQMESFSVGVIYNLYSNLILANVDKISNIITILRFGLVILISLEKINKIIDWKDDEFVEEINLDEMVSCVIGGAVNMCDNKAILRSNLSTQFIALYNVAKANWMLSDHQSNNGEESHAHPYVQNSSLHSNHHWKNYF
ncbi:hypothetical protein ACFE04_021322 [Oxalis oulophora]